LIKNSVEATDKGGQIRVKTEEVADGDVAVYIIDNGEGIPENIMNKIFEPYFTTRRSGTGLGLVIVYKILKELGGDLTINSKVDEGTVVRVKLPVLEKNKKLLTFEENDEGQVVNS
jgi:signal transduction histidine kinase